MAVGFAKTRYWMIGSWGLDCCGQEEHPSFHRPELSNVMPQGPSF